MKLRIGGPEYGGIFAAHPAGGEAGAVVPPLRFVLPGEMVETAPGAGDGATAILQASEDRVAARCRHFGVCGGCDYQHGSHDAQMEWKRGILTGLLEAGGLTDHPALELHASDPWEYRNRIRVRVESADGKFRFGYNRRASRDFLPIVECPISAPLLMRAAEALIGADSGAIMTWLPSIAEVEFHASDDGGVLQMTVFTRDRRVEGFRDFCEALSMHLPELAGAGLLGVATGYGAKERASWGAGGLAHLVMGRSYWVSRGGFFQVNRTIVAELVKLVTTGREGELAWDLYAGVGLFSRVLAESFETVIAVEAGSPAAEDLDRASRKIPALQAVKAETAAFLRGAVVQRERPSLIVMDPPRAGVGAEACVLLARIAAPEIVYVSCDPVTLVRDLKMLVDSGYRLAELHLLDMFPQTFHLETVVVLRR
jgi:23S rRNA (uracil1939-C5)-methyltransferase